jgi:hypothetical protein
MEILNLNINIDILTRTLDNINNAIILSKIKLASKDILEIKDLEFIYKKLKMQNFNVNSFYESLKYVEAETNYLNSTLAYIVNIPLTDSNFK